MGNFWEIGIGEMEGKYVRSAMETGSVRKKRFSINYRLFPEPKNSPHWLLRAIARWGEQLREPRRLICSRQTFGNDNIKFFPKNHPRPIALDFLILFDQVKSIEIKRLRRLLKLQVETLDCSLTKKSELRNISRKAAEAQRKKGYSLRLYEKLFE